MAGNSKAANAAKKSKDKWKSKEWYNIHAPRMFNETLIGETPAAEPELLIGRQVDVTVQELTGDFSKMHIKMVFKIVGFDGHEAKTEFVGHTLTSEYVRRLTRRKKTKTDHVVDVKTSDGYVLRIKTMTIADRRIQASQEEGMRAKIGEFLVAFGAENTLANVIKAVISGDLSKDTAKACHVVVPIKRVEIRKTEVLRKGDGEPESIVDAVSASSEEEEAPAEAPAEEAPAEEPAAEETPAEEAPAEESE